MALTTLQISDANGNAIPALQPVTDETVKVAAGASSARVALPSNYQLVRLYATVNAFVNLGSSTVTASSATDMPLAKDTPEIVVVKGFTHLSAIQASSAGEVIITPMK